MKVYRIRNGQGLYRQVNGAFGKTGKTYSRRGDATARVRYEAEARQRLWWANNSTYTPGRGRVLNPGAVQPPLESFIPEDWEIVEYEITENEAGTVSAREAICGT